MYKIWYYADWASRKLIRHFSPSLPKGVRQQSQLMQAKRSQVPKFRKASLRYRALNTRPEEPPPGQVMLTITDKWMLAISFFSLLKIVSILQPVYSFNNEFCCVEKTATLFTSSPSCSKGGWRYLGKNSTDFDSIWPMDSSLYTLNNWALIHVYVISFVHLLNKKIVWELLAHTSSCYIRYFL